MCVFPLTQPSDRNHIWHACVDRSGNGSKFQKSGKCHELLRKLIHLFNPSFFKSEGGREGGREGGGRGREGGREGGREVGR